MSYFGDISKNLIGRALERVSLDEPKTDLALIFKDGSRQEFDVEGDCCSRSWIEHLELPGDVDGAVITGVEDSAPVTQDHDQHDEDYGGDCINVYNTVFHTDRGDIVVEYRNSSNGYYGGWLQARAFKPGEKQVKHENRALACVNGDVFETQEQADLYHLLLEEGETIASEASDHGWGHHSAAIIVRYGTKYYVVEGGGCSCDGSASVSGPFDSREACGRTDLPDGDNYNSY